MTDGAVLWRTVLFLFLQRYRHEPNERISSGRWRVNAYDVEVLVVRETDAEFRNECPALLQRIVNVAETGKQPAAGVFRTVVDVTVRANRRRGSFTRKELFAMTGQTGGMLGKITDVRKGGVAFTYFFPILRGNFVA